MDLKELKDEIKRLRKLEHKSSGVIQGQLKGIKQTVEAVDNDLQELEQKINEKTIFNLKVIFKPEWLEIKKLLSLSKTM